ncbi:MAG: phenylalanine--tRNA ligase subunit beta [Anaerolineales bacterium]|nr:phenylalanine--tRNA ligase subunit beta [Anaerolineales bacterium]
MRVPISWLRDYVDIDLTPEQLAYTLTFGGLEVEEIEYVGKPMPKRAAGEKQAFKTSGIGWDPDKIVVAQILEVGAHPNADRLTLLRLDDGSGVEQTVLTGAPNIFHLKGSGPLAKPIKVAYAREGAVLYDGHKPGWELMTLKRAKIRGVESYSMVCSDKELGISEEHDGIILFPEDAPVGVPLADYIGDVVLTVKTNPNMARNTNIYGIAREVAALTGKPLRPLPLMAQPKMLPGDAPDAFVNVEITNPDLNPRFVAGLITGVTIRPSPYEVQRRLRLAGVRAISNIVDATNYVMLEVGQPLHSFDYSVLKRRSEERGAMSAVRIITRLPKAGETLKTLDGQERKLDPFTILVTDSTGALALGGVMGGAESEISDATVDILLEGAAWEFINIRKTLQAQKLSSEAGYRFSRGIHPAMTVRGVLRGLALMQAWGGGTIASELVDAYAKPAVATSVTVTPEEVERLLGVAIPTDEIVRILKALEFGVTVEERDAKSEERITATTPDHRLDIGEGAIGRADIIEEIARVYGYERIPGTTLADPLPTQRRNVALEREELARDVLAAAGLFEAQTYSLTQPEREARLRDPLADGPYVTLLNPITPERAAMRRTLLAGLLDIAATNLRLRERVALFEIGKVYHPVNGATLPVEPMRAAVVLAGARSEHDWSSGAAEAVGVDFFDVKGVVEQLLARLHVVGVRYVPGVHPTLMPGRAAELKVGDATLGWVGELHPEVRTAFDLPAVPVVVADLDLAVLLERVDERFTLVGVPEYPPVKEDLALLLDDAVPADQVAALIKQTGGATLTEVKLFDVYRGDKLGANKKSLAFSLTYQAPDRTLSGGEVAKLRDKIVKRLEREVGAQIRGA